MLKIAVFKNFQFITSLFLFVLYTPACLQKAQTNRQSESKSSRPATLCADAPCPLSEAYEEIWNEPVVLVDGSVVQGSAIVGGLQPDYEIDTDTASMRAFLEKARKRMAKETGYWQRINSAIGVVQEAIPNDSYTFPPYRNIMKNFKDAGKRIPLEAYLEVKGGVCRENAILLNLALSAGGVPSYYSYFVAELDDRVEDHAVVLVKDENNQEVFVADSYNSDFNARRLVDLTSKSGASKEHKLAPLKDTSFFKGARFLRLNSYPRYWLPKKLDPLKLQNDEFIDSISTLESGGIRPR
jgi:hypothetical protein